MTAKEAKLEVVTYRIENIREAAFALVATLAVHSGIPGVRQWIGESPFLDEIIKGEKSQQYSFNAPGLELSFSGFPRPIPTIVEDELIYRSREPRFTFYGKWFDIMPQERTRIDRISEDIAEEMSNRFHMKVARNPLCIIFPKQEFAKERVVFNAAILS